MKGTLYIGYAAGALTVLSLVPQVVRAYRTREVDEISWGLVWLLVVSAGLWIVFGVRSSQLPVILTNVGVVTLAMALVVAKARFGRQRAARSATARSGVPSTPPP